MNSFYNFIFIIGLFLASCSDNIDIKNPENGTTHEVAQPPTNALPVVADFGGWSALKAVGNQSPSLQGMGLPTTTASVFFSWDAATPASGALTTYSIYRTQTSGSYDYRNPIATGISASARTFTDSAVQAGQVYYYAIGALVDGTQGRMREAADVEIKVMVPEANMVLLHRWMANREMCEQMGRAFDRGNQYRCATVTGSLAPPGTANSGYVDLGYSLWVDAFEQGCNYTASNSCVDATVNGGVSAPCLGIRLDPNGNVSAAANTTYYSRQSAKCFFNTSAGSGSTWTEASSLAPSTRALLASNAPGLPPLVFLNQPESQSVCINQSISSAPLPRTKRLLTRKEFVLVSAWNKTLSDSAINSLEIGADLSVASGCNSNFASPQGSTPTTDISAGANAAFAFDNFANPTNKDTLPGCWKDDCAASGTTTNQIRSLRTGSLSTRSCLSAYGAQDLVGNVAEWSSDQISCDGTNCFGQVGISNTVDSSNVDWSGVAFDSVQAPKTAQILSFWGRVQWPTGLPIVSAVFAGDGVITRSSAQLHGDYFFFNGATAGARGAISGGRWNGGSGNGRLSIHLGHNPTQRVNNHGLRCALPAP